LRRSGHVLCRQSQGRRPRLPADVHRHLCEGCLRYTVRSQDADHGGGCEYELYLAVEDIDHSRTKTKSPQTNGICERFHKTVLNEFYRVAFRKKVYRSIDELQTDLDCWITEYNAARPSRTLVLRENSTADVPRCNADSKGENDRSLIASDTKT
jgi:transposase InsO family protein